MRIVLRHLVLASLLLALSACGKSAPGGTAPGGTAPGGTVYGDGVKAVASMAISELCARIDELEGKSVRVEGLVTDVCPKRGCWFKLASDREFESLTFKVVDGVMVFPMSMKGKYAVAEGVARKIELSLEQTRKYLAHLAEEKGEPFDPVSITEPMTYVKLDGTGAVVRDQP